MRETHSFPALRDGDVFLNPGELHCGFAPARIWTILGSCVSIILWDSRLRFGAMTHYLLPERAEQHATGTALLDPRYGLESCELLLAAMRRAGVRAERCQARLFGGSNTLANAPLGASSIGRRNAAVAQHFLRTHHIRLVSQSLYGVGHRRVFFDLQSGRVWECEAGDPQAADVRKSGSFS